MDYATITGAVGALQAAIGIGKAAVDVRDANALAGVVAQMNEKLLDAQHRLLAHNSELLALQQEHFKATQELREVKEALAERQKYALFEVSQGQFAYRVDIPPEASAPNAEFTPEPEHYLCQPCFDGTAKSKVVLRFIPPNRGTNAGWYCPTCNGKLWLADTALPLQRLERRERY